jgi:hypothetical protein
MASEFNNRIELDDSYSMVFDGRCISLVKKVVITGEGRGAHLIKKENIGKVKDHEEGFYGRLDQALSAYMTKTVCNSCSDVTTILAKLSEIEKTLTRFNVKCKEMEVATLVEK